MFRIMHWLTSGLAILKLAKTRRKGEIEMPMDTKTDFCGHFKTGVTKFEKVLLRDPILSVFSSEHGWVPPYGYFTFLRSNPKSENPIFPVPNSDPLFVMTPFMAVCWKIDQINRFSLQELKMIFFSRFLLN